MFRAVKLALFSFVLASLAAAAWTAAPAAAGPADALDPEKLAAVEQVSTYFNKMRTMQGDFTQVGPKGHVSTGTFYIAKPGRLRFEYAPPNPFVVVADGTWVTIKNNAKETADQYPLAATPLRLVLADNVDLKKQAAILAVEKSDGVTTLTLEDKDKMVPGQLVLVFDTAKDELQQWVIVDGQGRRTTISLGSLMPGIDPDPRLFRVALPPRRAKTSK
jgi:outer membrane lipoprotein-sorting protein